MHARTLDLVRAMDSRRFLTLTLRSTNAPLADQLDRLIDCFRRLRRLNLWKTHVAGGVWAIEVTWSAERGQWHPHLHAIIDGTYLPWAALRDAWSAITGDSSIVDIRRCDDARDAARYISSYIGKLADVASLPEARVVEYAAALHRRRLSGTFGRSHASTLERATDLEPDAPATRIVPASRLIDAYLAGIPAANAAVATLAASGRHWATVLTGASARPPARPPSRSPQAVASAIAYARTLKEPDHAPQPPPQPRPPPPLLPFDHRAASYQGK
jgi:hypothetical protein